MTWTQTTLTLKDAAGNNQSIIAYTDGSSYSLAHPILDNTGAIIAPATSGKQDAILTALGSLLTAANAGSTAALQTAANALLTALATNSATAALQTAGNNLLNTIAANAPPVPGVTTMTVGTPVTAGRAFAVNCTGAGNVAMTLSDSSIYIAPVTAGLTVFPFAVTQVNSSGTTATATYANWK